MNAYVLAYLPGVQNVKGEKCNVNTRVYSIFFVLERGVNQNLIIKVPYYFEIIINQENWQ